MYLWILHLLTATDSSCLLQTCMLEWLTVFANRDEKEYAMFNRMREVEKAEKEKPENRGRDVRYDPVKRTLSVNGVVIDQFKPQFFQ